MSTELCRHPVIVTAARFGLGVADPLVRLDPTDAQRVIGLAKFDHLTGFLAATVNEGAVAIEPEDRELLMTNWHEELLACVALESLAARTGQHLDRAGIEWRLTKGAALAHVDYADPSLRTFGDVDLIVHPDHWLGAVDVLTSLDYRREAAELHGDYDRRFGKGATFTSAAGLEIDLHRRYAIGRFGVTSHMADVFESPEHFSLAGVQIPTLNAEHRLLHACYHASLGGFRELRAFRDVAQLLLVTRADLDRTIAIARRWRAESVVASAIIDTWNRLNLDRNHYGFLAAQDIDVSSGDARALNVFQSEQPFRRQALTAVGRLRYFEIPLYLWSLGSTRLPWRHRTEPGGHH